MKVEKRIEGFIELGKRLAHLHNAIPDEWTQGAMIENPWFTPDNVKLALSGVASYLEEEALRSWLDNYTFQTQSPKNVGVVMAGNIPLVGFHDFLCVLLSGHNIHIKTSSQDSFLLKSVIRELVAIDEEFEERIIISDRLKGMDAMIATGSDNSSRYFEYYFKDTPHIIRKNRTSVAILTGQESEDDLKELGKDIFQYFGLGCRNVSKLYLPEKYELNGFFEAVQHWEDIAHHNKYKNNYDYRKSIFLVNNQKHLDNGFLLLEENHSIVSPIGVLYYEYFKDRSELKKMIENHQDKIQCIVAQDNELFDAIYFGRAQHPKVTDYADNVDTMSFLAQL